MIYFPGSYAIRVIIVVLLFALGLLLYIYAQGGVSRAIYPQP